MHKVVLRSVFLGFAALSSSSIGGCDDGATAGTAGRVVYIQRNDPAGNAIIALSREADGSLSTEERAVYPTGGVGLAAHVEQGVGRLDTDRNLVLSEDGRLLFAVNSGSDTIAAFRTNADGSLTPVYGSPFPSGGRNPVSLALRLDTLFVVHKAEDGAAPPTYNALHVSVNGGLMPLTGAGSSAELSGSPWGAYMEPRGRFLFGTQLLPGVGGPVLPDGQIDVFAIEHTGRFSVAPGSPHQLPPDTSGILPPPMPSALNLISHPTRQVLYVALPARNQLAVYTYGDDGVLTFVKTVPNSGQGICWLLVDEGGTRLFTVSAASATVSVYDLSDAEAPVERSSLTLRYAESGPPFVDAMGARQTVTSRPFQLALDRAEAHLYVVSQRVTTNVADETGNYLHVLEVDGGDLHEREAPIDLRGADIAATARPQGVLVF